MIRIPNSGLEINIRIMKNVKKIIKTQYSFIVKKYHYDDKK